MQEAGKRPFVSIEDVLFCGMCGGVSKGGGFIPDHGTSCTTVFCNHCPNSAYVAACHVAGEYGERCCCEQLHQIHWKDMPALLTSLGHDPAKAKDVHPFYEDMMQDMIMQCPETRNSGTTKTKASPPCSGTVKKKGAPARFTPRNDLCDVRVFWCLQLSVILTWNQMLAMTGHAESTVWRRVEIETFWDQFPSMDAAALPKLPSPVLSFEKDDRNEGFVGTCCNCGHEHIAVIGAD